MAKNSVHELNLYEVNNRYVAAPSIDEAIAIHRHSIHYLDGGIVDITSIKYIGKTLIR